MFFSLFWEIMVGEGKIDGWRGKMNCHTFLTFSFQIIWVEMVGERKVGERKFLKSFLAHHFSNLAHQNGGRPALFEA